MKERLPIKQLNKIKEIAGELGLIAQLALDPRTDPLFQKTMSKIKNNIPGINNKEEKGDQNV